LNRFKISLAIFVVFLSLQGFHLLRAWGWKIFPVSLPRFTPVAYVMDERIQPPRCYVETQETPHARGHLFVQRQIHPNGSVTLSSPVPPLVAFVMGRPMDWKQVTESDLRLIPGVSAAMARRLIRIRDTEHLSKFDTLRHFPHIGAKTVQRLKTYCMIAHES